METILDVLGQLRITYVEELAARNRTDVIMSETQLAAEIETLMRTTT